ncbi:MAG: fibronectin type III domain-containing protein [Flavobacteriales bacterium]|nr:fibronectin type III domain-containing protein [Flavobacteriales bacterium]
MLLTNAITDSAGGDHEKVVIRQKAEDALGILLLREALYVSNVAQGDEPIILSSGFEARKPPTPIGPWQPPWPSGPLPGSIDLRWDPVKGAHWYRLLVNSTDPDVEAQWTVLDEITQASFAATGLDPAKHYWFRVCAVGPLGPGAFSDPAKGFSAPLP